MLTPAEPDAPPPEPLPDGLVEVGVYPTFTVGFHHGLVVLAAGRPYWLVPGDGGHRLMVEPDAAEVVRWQLAKFDRESVGWPPTPAPVPMRSVETVTPLLWALLVLGVFWGQTTHPHWMAAGALDSMAVFQRHEWWRPVTALFLHADAAHVLSNGLSGIFVFAALLSTLGRARGWAALAVASIIGNVAVVAINAGVPYTSVGASTAVFAAVGLLTGHAVRRLFSLPARLRWRAMAVPLASGLTVLALYGAGGVRVDVGAHLTGFVAGLLVGVVSWLKARS